MTGDRADAIVIFAETHKCLPYVRAVERRGMHPLVVGLLGHSPLAQRAITTALERREPLDTVREFSVHAGDDTAGICADVLRWSRHYNVRAAVIASESLVEAASLATTLLGVPSIGMKAGRICRDKSLQRVVFDDLSPRWRLVRGNVGTERGVRKEHGGAQAAEIVSQLGGLPIVAKPTRLESSQGVRTLSTSDDVEATINDIGVGEVLLLEERIYGPEYTVDAIVAGGRVAAIFMSEKRTNEDSGPYFVELAHTVPPRFGHPQHRLTLEAACIKVVERLGIEAGMVHGEFRLTEDGRAVLMEIAARPPGDATVPMYSLSTGRSVEDMLIDACLGHPVALSAQYVRQVRQVYLNAGSGVLADVRVADELPAAVHWLADGSGVWPELVPPADTLLDNGAAVTSDAGAVRGILALKPRGSLLGDLVESGSRPVTLVIDVPVGGDIDAFEKQVEGQVQIVLERGALR